MELAGEVMTGHFFNGLATPQFITPRALSALTANLPASEHFWMSATDPTAPCGLGLDWEGLPQRRQGSYLAFVNSELALVVEGNGRTLRYHLAWDDPALDECNEVLLHLVQIRRMTLRIETINQLPAKESPYLGTLMRRFDTTQDHKHVFLQPSF